MFNAPIHNCVQDLLTSTINNAVRVAVTGAAKLTNEEMQSIHDTRDHELARSLVSNDLSATVSAVNTKKLMDSYTEMSQNTTVCIVQKLHLSANPQSEYYTYFQSKLKALGEAISRQIHILYATPLITNVIPKTISSGTYISPVDISKKSTSFITKSKDVSSKVKELNDRISLISELERQGLWLKVTLFGLMIIGGVFAHGGTKAVLSPAFIVAMVFAIGVFVYMAKTHGWSPFPPDLDRIHEAIVNQAV